MNSKVSDSSEEVTRLTDRFATPLNRAFYDRPARVVGRALLGQYLIHRRGSVFRGVRLVESEAYVANDPANHAWKGRTTRNRSMYDRPGTLYVYQIHQVFCANAVTRPGQAVLLRAGAPLTPELGTATGPGRLCRALGITRAMDGNDLLSSEIRIVPGPPRVEPILTGPRVGLRKAADWPLRFALAGNPWVSRPRPEISPAGEGRRSPNHRSLAHS